MSQVIIIDTSATNITRFAYLEVVASLSQSYSKIMITDKTGKLLQFAVGAAGAEVPLFAGGFQGATVIGVPMEVYLEKGQRLSITTVDANATTGLIVVSLIQ